MNTLQLPSGIRSLVQDRITPALFPYRGQKARMEIGYVLEKQILDGVIPFTNAYFAWIEVCRHQDAQTLYGPDHTPRVDFVRISKQLYDELYQGASLTVFCKFHSTNKRRAKIWLAH